MPLQTLEAGTNQIVPEAVLQMAALQLLVANRRHNQLQQVLAQFGDTEILAWEPNVLSLPPAFAAIRSGGNYFLVIAGTATLKDAAVDLFAILPNDWFGFPSKSHAGFQIVEGIMHDRLTQHAPDPANFSGKIVVVGFSLGGGIATLLALRLLPVYGAERVQLLTFGAPRALTGTYDGALPSVMQRVCLDGDPIPDLPPSNSQFFLAAKGNFLLGHLPLLWYSRQSEFTHYGRRFVFRDTGELTLVSEEDRYNASWDPRNWDVHSSLNYYRTMRRWALGQ